MKNKLPAPLTNFKLDPAKYPDFPMAAANLIGSQLAAYASDAAFRAAVLLWNRSWHADPAASVPGDDAQLARAINRDLKTWMEIRDEALHGFVLCSDGRYYHRIVAQKAIAAYHAKEKATAQRKEAANKRWGNKNGDKSATSPSEGEGMRADMRADMRPHENVKKTNGSQISNNLRSADPAPQTPSKRANGRVLDSLASRAPVSTCALPALTGTQKPTTSLTVKQQAAPPGDRGVRGEIISAPSKVKKPRASDQGMQLPEDWTPSADEREHARRKWNLTDDQINDYAEEMKLWAGANGHRREARKQGLKGWHLAFLGWIARDQKRKKERSQSRGAPSRDRLDPLQKAMQLVAEAEAAERSQR